MKMEKTILEANVVKISVKAEEMNTPILGFSFKINVPEGYKFIKHQAGNFLEKGGNPIYLVENSGSEVIFGETLLDKGSLPKGSGEVASFYFQGDGVDSDFVFRDGIVSTFDSEREDLSGVEWLGVKSEQLEEENLESSSEKSGNYELPSVELNFLEIGVLGLSVVILVAAIIIYLKPNNKG